MTEILQLIERVKNTIQLGESHFREFKSALEGKPDNKKPRRVAHICEDIAEALVAFANADGGELIIGVEDDGRVSGILHDPAEIDMMLNATQTHTLAGTQLPLIYSTTLNLEGGKVLFFQVAKGTQEIYQLADGRCMRRKDLSTVPLDIRQIQMERQEVLSREYDRQFVDGAGVTDLDLPLLQAIADGYFRGMSVELYLQQVGLAEYSPAGLRLRRATLLLFAKDMLRWHPRSEVRILKVNGNALKSGNEYNVISDESVRGNILTLIERSWEALRPYLAYKTEFSSDARFEQRYIYPEAACRESLTNAIAHRDYSVQNGIEVYIFEDRLEVRSPGRLLSTLMLDDLRERRGSHESRNPLIARVLRESLYMRELGEGIRRIFEEMERNALDRPILYSNSTWFSVTLNRKHE
ncbi:MAG: ATP-binding protein [Phototrophicaceae bacterium]|jgi:ATP-dependent DNA helicase RecG